MPYARQETMAFPGREPALHPKLRQPHSLVSPAGWLVTAISASQSDPVSGVGGEGPRLRATRWPLNDYPVAWTVPTVPSFLPNSSKEAARISTVRSHSSRVITSGGQSWVVGSPRSSLRRIRPCSRIRSVSQASSPLSSNVALVERSLTNSTPRNNPAPRISPTFGWSANAAWSWLRRWFPISFAPAR